jgi:hypothetical protein
MSTVIPKEYVLPFQKDSAKEVEAAAIYALVELERGKGSGLIVKQEEEQLLFLSRLSYPLWLFTNNDLTFIWDGLNFSSFTVVYTEVPSSKLLMKNLESSNKLLEDYLTFLSNYGDYFRRPLPNKQFTINGLIADNDFRNDFEAYSKEAVEASDITAPNFFSIASSLDLKAIEKVMAEFNSMQSTLKEEAENLPECIKLITKTTSQFKTEIEYQSMAAKEEIEAKIKAQAKFVNPQIITTNKQYNQKIKNVTRSFEKNIEQLQKQLARTRRAISKSQKKIINYELQAEAQEKLRHLIYEKRSREKIKRTESELSGLKKEFKVIENNIEKLSKEKVQAIYRLKFDLETEIKHSRQPIVDLEAARDTQIIFFRQKILKMLDLETLVVEGLNRNLRCWDSVQEKFANLGIKEKFDHPVLFFVPFYYACFTSNEKKRNLIVPPSSICYAALSTKLKGAFGLSKIKNILNPRFKSISTFIRNLQKLTNQNVEFENQLFRLGEENNLLRNSFFQTNVEEGLTYLKQASWLSDKEYQSLSRKR